MAPEREIESILFLGLVSKQVRDGCLGVSHVDTKDIVTVNLGKERSDPHSDLHSTHLFLILFL